MSGPTLLRLKVRDPHGQERELSFTQEVVTIGRSGECDLTLESGFISRFHARLLYTDSGWQIADEGSKNGVFVNGQRVSGTVPVATGDALRIGDFGVTVEEAEATEADHDERTVIASRSAAAGVAPHFDVPEPEPEDERTVRVLSPSTPPPSVTGDPTKLAAVGEASEPAAVDEASEQPVVGEKTAAIEEPLALESAPDPATHAPEPPAAVVPALRATEVPAADNDGAVTAVPDSDDQVQSSIADTNLPGDLTVRERMLLEALTAAGPAGAGPADLVEAIWGTGGGDGEMLERLLSRTQQKLGTRQIVRLPGGILRLD